MTSLTQKAVTWSCQPVKHILPQAAFYAGIYFITAIETEIRADTQVSADFDNLASLLAHVENFSLGETDALL